MQKKYLINKKLDMIFRIIDRKSLIYLFSQSYRYKVDSFSSLDPCTIIVLIDTISLGISSGIVSES